jgi:hypothetical protein
MAQVTYVGQVLNDGRLSFRVPSKQRLTCKGTSDL